MLRVAFALFAWVLLSAQTPMMPGFPPGAFQSRAAIDAAPAASYTGPGDTFTTSPYAAYSCAEAFTAAYANGTNPLCDVVLTVGGAAACTIRVGTDGKADLSGTYCVGTVTLATACAAGCSVSQVYDQTGNTRHVVQATLSSMPTLTLSSTPTGTLPAINCAGGTNATMQTSGSLTQAQPLTSFAVYNRNGAVQLGGIIGETAGGDIFLGAGASANTVSIISATGLTSGTTATDATWLAVSTLASGASSAINIMAGTETTGNAGTAGLSTNLRICRGGGSQYLGLLAEVQMWAATSNNTERNSLATNARSSGRYNF